MTRIRASRRLIRRSAALAGALTLGVTGTALADITGTVRTPDGSPVAGVSVTAREPDGSIAAAATTNGAGQYVIPTSQLTGDIPPFTLSAESNLCRVFPETAATASGTAPGDGVVVDLTLDARLFCATSSFGAPEATAHAWPQRGLILAPPGGTLTLQVQAGSTSGGGYTLTLQDGTVVGTGTSRFSLPLTAPATPYNGPLNLVYTDSSGPQTARIATLQVGRPPVSRQPAANLDLLAIVDVSGSMGSNDPGFRRKTAVQLLIDLASTGDRLAAVGFDDSAKPIFARTTVSGNAVKNRLKGIANRRIVNAGGTDYNDGFVPGFDALTADPLNPQRPKAVIFLTDGAHNSGAYENAHLRFAFNGTGSSWPVCVVQLGRSGFDADDVARLRRIAADTGGIFVRTPTNAELENLYFRCFGRSSGEKQLGAAVVRAFRVGQVRSIVRRVPAKQRRATFFVSFQQGRYRLVLRQPGGKVYTKSVGNRVRLVKSRTFAFFRVNRPKAGRWTLRVQRLPSGGSLDRATTTVSVLPPR